MTAEPRAAASTGTESAPRSVRPDIGREDDLEIHLVQVRLRQALARIENLDSNHASVGVEVEDESWRDLLGLRNRRLIEANVDRIGLLIEAHSHRLVLRRPPRRVRSKKAVTTR
jgi:hypothetical protein